MRRTRTSDGGRCQFSSGGSTFVLVKLFPQRHVYCQEIWKARTWHRRVDLAFVWNVYCQYRFLNRNHYHRMSETLKPHPSVQRLNKAYVQVPESPVGLVNYRAIGASAHLVPSSRLKENTPLSPFQLAMAQHASSSSASTKRKLSDRDSSSLVFDGVYVSSSKKSRLSTSAASMTPLKAKALKPAMPAANACPEFPNGFAYCHQCNKKRDISGKGQLLMSCICY